MLDSVSMQMKQYVFYHFFFGRVQVGCSTALGALTNILYHGQWNLLCNHRRAFRFFIDSVHQDCTFRAFSCTSYEDYVRGLCFYCGPDGRRCSNMGYFANLSQGRGQMYLITRDKEPFCGLYFSLCCLINLIPAFLNFVSLFFVNR